MRRMLSFSSMAVLVACSGGEEASEALQEAAERTQQAVADAPASLLARIGGTLVPTGGFHVEVLPHRDGIVEALVYDDRGQVIEDAGELKVQVPGADGSAHEITLAWDPEEGKYVGAYPGGIASSGAVAVEVSAGGQSFTGSVGKLAFAPGAPQRGGTVVVAGDYAAELVAKPDGSVTAYVVDGDGNPVSGEEARVQVELEVGGATRPIALRWDPQVGAYVGRPEGELQWTGGAVALSVDKGGARHRTRVARVAPAPAPSHGGDIVVAGDLAVEVVPEGDGELKAYVVNAAGEAVADPAQTQVVVMVDQRPVVLAWDPAEGAYKGTIDARLDVAAAPLQVAVVHRGRRRWGGVHVRHARRLRPWHQRRVQVRATLPPAPVVHTPAFDAHLFRHPRFGLRSVRGVGVDRGGELRAGVRLPGLSAMASIRGPSAMVNLGPAGAVRVRGPGMQSVIVGPMGGVSVRGPGGTVQVRGPGGAVRVQAPGLASVMVHAPRPSGMASVRVRGPGGGASIMVRVGTGGMRHGMRRRR